MTPEDLIRMVTGIRIRYRGMTPFIQPEPNDCAAIVVWTRWHGDQK